MADDDAQPNAGGTASGVTVGAPNTSPRNIPSTYKLPKGLELLDGANNWDTWSFRMKNVFEAEDVWGIVEGTETKPTGEPTSEPAMTWEARNRAARITINLAITPNCIPLVINAKTTCEAWKALSDAYKPKGLLTVYYYRQQLSTFRFNESQPFGPQIDQMRQLRIKQQTAGIPCEDWDFTVCLIGALPESYSVIKQSILAAQTDLKKLDLASIISLISQEEVDRKGFSHANIDPEVAFASWQAPRPTRTQKDQKKTGQDKKGACNWCKREGHWESDCRKKKESQAQAQQGAEKSNQRRTDKQKGRGGKGDGSSGPDQKMWVAKLIEDEPTEEAKATPDHPTAGEWWEFDSGATRVFHGNLKAFSNYKPFDKPIPIGLANDGATTNALGTGSISIRFFPPDSPPVPVCITTAYYVPGIVNLISISHLDNLGRKIQFHSKRIDIWNGEVLELSIPHVGNSYRCRGEVELPEHVHAHAAKLSNASWHRRCGHLGHTSLLEMTKKELVDDLDIDIQVSGSTPTCNSCLRGKHTRTPFPTSGRTRATKLLDLVHSDICGPFPITREGYKYYITFLDDHTEYGVVYRLREKSGAAEAFKDYHVRAEKATSGTLRAVQTDNGGEYEGDFERYCTLHGIHHRRSTPYTPEQNGVAERLNRTLNDAVVSCLIDANLGDAYWGEALIYAMYTRNRAPSRAIPGYVPYTLWNNGTKPSVAHLRPFGCTAYVHIPKKVRKGKLAKKATKAMFVGYDSNRKAWRFYVPETHKEVSSRDVTFLEDVPYTLTKESLTFGKSTKVTSVTVEDNSDSEDEPFLSSPSTIPIPNPTSASTSIPIPTPNSSAPSLTNPPPPTTTRPRRNVNATPKYTDTTWMPQHHARAAYEFGLAATDPRTYEEALSGPDSKQWEKSIQAEYQSLVDTGTFEVVDLPAGRKAIPCTYVFKEKTGPDGQTVKFKTRIVARGDLQKKGEDFDKVFAPVPRLDTVCAVFSYAASQDWDIDQLDFKSAFLNGDLKEEVYMKPPKGFETSDGKVWRLKKTLYGLWQSPKCWHEKLTSTFKEFKLVRSTADFCVYVGRFGDDIIILITHVDDMAITGSSKEKKDEVKRFIKSRFDVDDMGLLHFYLAIEWNRDCDKQTITAHQGKFARTILERFSMLDCYPTDTPIVANHQFTIADCPSADSKEKQKMARVPYLEAIGSLMYLMLGTRPDLAYTIRKLSRFGSNPGKKHWEGVKRVMHYLKGTLDHSLILGGLSSTTPLLIGYSDASFQDCPDTSRSTSGYVFYLNDGPISWSSKRQGVVTNSTMESEYLGLSNAARQAIWLRELLEDLGCQQENPTLLYGDNNATLILAQDISDHSRAKHIKRVYHYVRERIQQEKDIYLEYCPGKDNIADIFTKPLGSEVFSKFLSHLVTTTQ